MSFDRTQAVDDHFAARLRADGSLRAKESSRRLPFAGQRLLTMFESQLICRHLDLAARTLRKRDAAYYTIASAGHEGNVVLGDVARHTDPAFLHYRSGALMVQRSQQVPGIDIVRDTLLGLRASSVDPIAGGRHKVWGSRPLWVPPQTSTIASHLPKAVGAAMAIDRGHRLDLELPVPSDSIVICSFGDASVNHSTAQGAFNATSWMAYQKLPLPLLFVCEDNGMGISVPTPPGWIEKAMRLREGITYMSADGLDLLESWTVARAAVNVCRASRAPVFLHLHVTRLMGHAGSDIEREYRSQSEIEETEAKDPLLVTARLAIEQGLLDVEGAVARYEAVRKRVAEAAEAVRGAPRLESAVEVMEPLAPYDAGKVAAEAARPPAEEIQARQAVGRQRHLAGLINRGLHEALTKYPEALVFGEDVARKGGVYHVTANLWKTFGGGRVFNTLLDEQGILGLAIGAAHTGLLPIPEIQYLAYFHNAEDQLRGEACSLQFFSRDQFRNPMVVRIASYGYQKGFGGHFHNDNSIAVLRDIPGLVIASPARGDDAVKMLRTCLALAKVSGRVVAFLEPIALYMTKDLYAEGDGEWLCDYPPAGEAITLGEGRVYEESATDLTIVSYANGLWLSLRAAHELAKEGIRARVVDLRWLAPLNLDLIEEQARATGRLLVVDECRRSGCLGEAVLAGIAERCAGGVRMKLVAGHDTYIPLGPAMDRVLPSQDDIERAARALVQEPEAISNP